MICQIKKITLSPNDIKTINIKCRYLDINQIKSSIPKIWKVKIRQTDINSTTNTLTLKIEINNKYPDIQKTSYKDFYWHVINKMKHEQTSRVKWSKIFTNLTNPG